nr:GAF domain-containing protein [uncultured Flavobacterium sp.]
MNKKEEKESPFQILISFKTLIDKLQEIANTDTVHYRVEYANSLLKEVNKVPELYDGFTDLDVFHKHKSLISNLVSELFPTALTHNEIKAISFPFQDVVYNYTERFKKILKEAGHDFKISAYEMDSQTYYIMCCNLILHRFYGENLEIVKSLKYEIPDAYGIKNYYKINFNIDFIEVIPTEKSVEITPEVIKLLKNNIDDIALWKQYFPLESWLIKGFGIINLIDITMDHAVSKLKSALINTSFYSLHHVGELSDLYQSIFKIPDIQMGFVSFDQFENVVKLPEVLGIKSFSVKNENNLSRCLIPKRILNEMAKNKTHLVYNIDILEASEDPAILELAKHYKSNNIGSLILAPVIRNDKVANVSEFVSADPDAFNMLNARKIENFMPFIIQTAERMVQYSQSQLEAIIQNEFTSIHKSVYWKFLEEAKKYQDGLFENKQYNFKDIKFKNVFPIYGVSDIKSSTKMRIFASHIDIKAQLNEILQILDLDENIHNTLIIEQRKIEIHHYLNEIKETLFYNVEYEITEFIKEKIHTFFRANIFDNSFGFAIVKYFQKIDPETEMYYVERKKYDRSINLVNNKLASILDFRQIEAQEIFSHYYERFVSDGIDFNMYIGSSISPDRLFDKVYTQNLRLWQLQVMCEMVRNVEQLTELEYDIHLTSLILVYSNSINIKFRMEEKKFDIDGAMNAVYEAVKKRLEKAYIKGTTHRIVDKNKLTIVYNNPADELEYKKYLSFLQSKNIIGKTIEIFEVEEMQSITGYKAIRVDILNTEQPANYYSFQDFLKQNLTDYKS